MAVAVREHPFKIPPLIHHYGQKFPTPRIDRRIKFHRYPQRSGRGHQMRLRHRERCSIMKALLDRHVEPAKDLHWVQPVNGCQRIQFVQTRHNSTVLYICQPANVHDEVGTASACRQFVAGAFHISISESESLAGLPQTKRSEEHTSELQSHSDLVCRLLLEKKKKKKTHQREMRYIVRE